MFKKTFFGLFGFVFLSFAQYTHAAETGTYFGVDVLNWTYTQSGNSGGSTGIRGVYGQKFNPNFGWELQMATGGSASIPPYGTVQMNALGGIYLRASFPIGVGDLHALFGLGSGSFSNASSWTFQSGTSYGFGGEFNLGETMALRADYMQNVSSSNWEAKSITFGVNFYF
jgi:hypothetical protein